MTKLKIGLHGATGRMGMALQEVIARHPDTELVVQAPDEHDKHALFFDTLNEPGAVNLVIDFSVADAVVPLAERCVAASVPLVSGTTGLNASEIGQLQELAGNIPILWAPNMSEGVNLVNWLLEQAASLLDESWDAEIVESHHKFKKDAPSGTALLFGEAVARGRGANFDDVADFARHGRELERKPGQIGFSSLRGGDIVGEHEVFFIGDGERVEINHRIHNRSTFAAGAVRCALWLKDKPAGWYRYQDMIQDRLTSKA